MKTLLLLIVVVLLAGCGDPNYVEQNNKIACTPGELVKDINGYQGYCDQTGYIVRITTVSQP